MGKTAHGRRIILKERLQKVLSHAGVASRRKAEELIVKGLVRVNGRVVKELGTEADPAKDRVEVDGKRIRPEPLRYFLLNKPDRAICSVRDPQGRRTVLDFFPKVKERIFPVGRLDYHSEGLLLLTNDGDLDFILTHPSHEVKKTYEVTVRGKFSEALAAKMAKGVSLPDGRTAPCDITVRQYDEARNRTYLTMTLHEGKNREIRRMMEAFHYPVFALTRVSYSFLTLEGVAKGSWRALTESEVRRLYELHK